MTERIKAEKKSLHMARTLKVITIPPIKKKDRDFHNVIIAYTSLMNKYCGTLPLLTNYSCLIQLYTLFEDRGTALCNELRRRDTSIPLKLSELGKPNFDTIKTYLTKLCGVHYNHWNEIQLLAELRHRIVHNNGHTTDPKLIARIKQTKGLRLNEPYNPKGKKGSKDDPMFERDPEGVERPEVEKKKPQIIVKNAYIDYIVPIVSGLFDKVFVEKKFGDPSPFTHSDSQAPLTVTGSGKRLKVVVHYND